MAVNQFDSTTNVMTTAGGNQMLFYEYKPSARPLPGSRPAPGSSIPRSGSPTNRRGSPKGTPPASSQRMSLTSRPDSPSGGASTNAKKLLKRGSSFSKKTRRSVKSNKGSKSPEPTEELEDGVPVMQSTPLRYLPGEQQARAFVPLTEKPKNIYVLNDTHKSGATIQIEQGATPQQYDSTGNLHPSGGHLQPPVGNLHPSAGNPQGGAATPTNPYPQSLTPNAAAANAAYAQSMYSSSTAGTPYTASYPHLSATSTNYTAVQPQSVHHPPIDPVYAYMAQHGMTYNSSPSMAGLPRPNGMLGTPGMPGGMPGLPNGMPNGIPGSGMTPGLSMSGMNGSQMPGMTGMLGVNGMPGGMPGMCGGMSGAMTSPMGIGMMGGLGMGMSGLLGARNPFPFMGPSDPDPRPSGVDANRDFSKQSFSRRGSGAEASTSSRGLKGKKANSRGPLRDILAGTGAASTTASRGLKRRNSGTGLRKSQVLSNMKSAADINKRIEEEVERRLAVLGHDKHHIDKDRLSGDRHQDDEYAFVEKSKKLQEDILKDDHPNKPRASVTRSNFLRGHGGAFSGLHKNKEDHDDKQRHVARNDHGTHANGDLGLHSGAMRFGVYGRSKDAHHRPAHHHSKDHHGVVRHHSQDHHSKNHHSKDHHDRDHHPTAKHGAHAVAHHAKHITHQSPRLVGSKDKVTKQDVAEDLPSEEGDDDGGMGIALTSHALTVPQIGNIAHTDISKLIGVPSLMGLKARPSLLRTGLGTTKQPSGATFGLTPPTMTGLSASGLTGTSLLDMQPPSPNTLFSRASKLFNLSKVIATPSPRGVAGGMPMRQDAYGRQQPMGMTMGGYNTASSPSYGDGYPGQKPGAIYTRQDPTPAYMVPTYSPPYSPYGAGSTSDPYGGTSTRNYAISTTNPYESPYAIPDFKGTSSSGLNFRVHGSCGYQVLEIDLGPLQEMVAVPTAIQFLDSGVTETKVDDLNEVQPHSHSPDALVHPNYTGGYGDSSEPDNVFGAGLNALSTWMGGSEVVSKENTAVSINPLTGTQYPADNWCKPIVKSRALTLGPGEDPSLVLDPAWSPRHLDAKPNVTDPVGQMLLGGNSGARGEAMVRKNHKLGPVRHCLNIDNSGRNRVVSLSSEGSVIAIHLDHNDNFIYLLRSHFLACSATTRRTVPPSEYEVVFESASASSLTKELDAQLVGLRGSGIVFAKGEGFLTERKLETGSDAFRVDKRYLVAFSSGIRIFPGQLFEGCESIEKRFNELQLMPPNMITEMLARPAVQERSRSNPYVMVSGKGVVWLQSLPSAAGINNEDCATSSCYSSSGMESSGSDSDHGVVEDHVPDRIYYTVKAGHDCKSLGWGVDLTGNKVTRISQHGWAHNNGVHAGDVVMKVNSNLYQDLSKTDKVSIMHNRPLEIVLQRGHPYVSNAKQRAKDQANDLRASRRQDKIDKKKFEKLRRAKERASLIRQHTRNIGLGQTSDKGPDTGGFGKSRASMKEVISASKKTALVESKQSRTGTPSRSSERDDFPRSGKTTFVTSVSGNNPTASNTMLGASTFSMAPNVQSNPNLADLVNSRNQDEILRVTASGRLSANDAAGIFASGFSGPKKL